MRLLAGRAPGGSILSGSCRTTLGGTYSGCRSVIGYATSVSTSPPSTLVFSCCQPAATGMRVGPLWDSHLSVSDRWLPLCMCLKACLRWDTEQQRFCRQRNSRLYLLQEAPLFEDLTLLENLEYACRLRQPVTTGAHQVHDPLECHDYPCLLS